MSNQNTIGPAIDTNPDFLTGTHGSHPLGTAVGAAATGAAAGALGGALGGPVGVVVGAVVGAVAGGVVGRAAAEEIDPTVEATYWREGYPTRPYADTLVVYEEYAPAYRYGWESYSAHRTSGRAFEQAEHELKLGWEKAKGSSKLTWEKAKHASRDAWNRVRDAASTSGVTHHGKK
jgi:phage tail tape-measure protein